MGKVVVIANQKGGVGKTTTAVNFSAALSMKGAKVLLIDIDSQGNATSALGVDKNNIEASLYEVFLGIFSLSSVIVSTVQTGLWLAPANIDLVGVEIAINQNASRENILKIQLKKLRKQFDYVIIDCPPSLNLLTLNALVAADSLLVPLQCEYFALEGISSLMDTFKLANENLNKDLVIEGVLLTMYDIRNNLTKQVEQETRGYFGDLVFKVVIPRNVKLSEAQSFGKPIVMYDINSPGAVAYLNLADEFLQKNQGIRKNNQEISSMDFADKAESEYLSEEKKSSIA